MNKKIITQSIVWRFDGKELQVLLLKRTPDRGGFWSAANGTKEDQETEQECRVRELKEEISIDVIEAWSDVFYEFTFKQEGTEYLVKACSAKVARNTAVIINEEHTKFQWVLPNQALKILRFDDDKKAMQEFIHKLEASS